MKRIPVSISIALLLALAGGVLAHPHFNKSVEISMTGLDLKLSYFTLPYNPERLEGIKEGFVFHCGNAALTVTGEIMVGGKKLLEGRYFVRAKAVSADEWTLILIPEAEAGDPKNPDVSKGIAMETKSYTDQAELHHLDLNLAGGHGSTDGKLLVTVAFGTRRVEGVLGLVRS